MNIKELRLSQDLSQKDFSEKYKIPLGTLRRWEQGVTETPDYVLQLLVKDVTARPEQTQPIPQMDTAHLLRVVSVLNEMARLSRNGIYDVANASTTDFDIRLFYDSSKRNPDGSYAIVHKMSILSDHYTIVASSYYDRVICGYTGGVFIEEGYLPYVLFRLPEEPKTGIIIEDGRWFFETLE